ncbi:OLC1v1002275C1 [Oldenlandia corymbosa var. corymbosa]|uniref:Magnesium transporter n=1 Tax=Oldenlandia corymbosa var. corymbosa TaxID=529605 RepID=A0AAV1DAQ8_OLDCO|nr:OLC1v1002275C1 [Oldenlandia corymbosa var. corymbosa]
MSGQIPPPQYGAATPEDDGNPLTATTNALPSAGVAPRKRAAGVGPWLLLDSSGQTQVFEAGKQAIMRRTGVPARDLRILDPQLSYPSSILGREKAIVINLEHIKAIVTAQEVILLNSDPSVNQFVEELQNRILDRPNLLLPFEFVVLESSLEAVCSVMENKSKTLEQETRFALDRLTTKIDTLNLETVRRIKSRLADITGGVQKVRDELEHLLDDDDDMAKTYLTQKLESNLLDDEEDNPDCEINNVGRKQVDVKELEMLLEAYFVRIDGTLNDLFTLRESVDDTEDYINVMLADKQNHLLQMGVLLTMATLLLSAFVVVAGVFGMNISIELFDPKFAGYPEFLWTVGGSTAGCVVLYVAAVAWCKYKRLLG